jgi:putative addiction module component (TIGR02574 family)
MGRFDMAYGIPQGVAKGMDMNATLYQEIVKLSPAERLQLAQDILDSVASEAFAPPLTEAQRAELRERLAHHRAHPDEPTVTLAEIKAKLGER